MAVQRFANGVSTAASTATLANFGMPDPTIWSVYMNDFKNLLDIDTTNVWVLTTVETGTATEVISDAPNGELLITNGTADNDSDFFQSKYETFTFQSGKEAFFKMKFKVADATESDFFMGLQIRDTDPLNASPGVTYGVYFQKDDGDASLDFHVVENSADTAASAIATISNNTFVTVGFYYDGGTSIEYFVDDVSKGTATNTAVLLDNGDYTKALTISFGLKNGAAAAKTMTVDYIFVASER